MFKNPFSFNGRIRRTEYGISFIIYFILYLILFYFVKAYPLFIIFSTFIPLMWFIWAQSAKRCHDVGNSGWWQIIPFYFLWLLFQDGVRGPNEYGENPKELNAIDPLNYRDDVYTDTGYGYNNGMADGLITGAIIADELAADDYIADDNNYAPDNNDSSYDDNSSNDDDDF